MRREQALGSAQMRNAMSGNLRRFRAGEQFDNLFQRLPRGRDILAKFQMPICQAIESRDKVRRRVAGLTAEPFDC